MLITTIEEVWEWYPNNTFQSYDKLKKYFEMAERVNLVPVLGTPLYKYIDKVYQDSLKEGAQPIGETDRRLLDLSQTVIVFFGTLAALPFLNVVINEMGGLTVTENTNTKVASKDRSDKLEEGVKRQAWDAIEQLLLFLESESKSFVDEEKKELWKRSEYYWQQTGCLIFTVREFEESGVDINGSRQKFKQLYPAMKVIQRTRIRSAVGDKIVKQLIDRKMNEKLSETDKDLLEYLQTALALYTISTDEELSRPDNIHGYKPYDASVLADQQLEMAKKLLRQNPDEYPDFYGNRSTEPVKGFENGNDKSVFALIC